MPKAEPSSLVLCRVQLIFYKDTANREQKTQTRLEIYAEMPRIFYKDTI